MLFSPVPPVWEWKLRQERFHWSHLSAEPAFPPHGVCRSPRPPSQQESGGKPWGRGVSGLTGSVLPAAGPHGEPVSKADARPPTTGESQLPGVGPKRGDSSRTCRVTEAEPTAF